MYASLNPMQMVGDIVGEPILNYHLVDKKNLKDEITILIKMCRYGEDAYYKYAHQFSGGQRQRMELLEL